MKYRGIVKDQLRVLPDRRTRTYSTYELAHRAAERLCRRTYGERGTIVVEIEEEAEQV